MPLTITEALAEIKTIGKRLGKKRDHVASHLARLAMVKDPLAADGGQEEMIKRERQAIGDLETRIVDLRMAIHKANIATPITILGQTRSIQEWLLWRRDVAPGNNAFLDVLRKQVNHVRSEAQKRGNAIAAVDAAKPEDVIININEQELANEIERVQEILGTLDGQLSLKNATVIVDA